MRTLQREIVICGAGAAGLGAAISAAENGAKVTILESRSRAGGISVTGMGIFAVESHLQKMKNHMLTREEAYHMYMDGTAWKADSRMVAKYVNRSASTIEWLESMGVRFQLLDITWGEGAINQTGHLVVTPQGFQRHGGITAFMVRAMQKRAEELGVEIVYDTELVELKRENNRITHVIAREKDGDLVNYEVKAVIITTGGYCHNAKILKDRNNRTLNKDYFLMHNIALDGKGIEAAWNVGAASGNMNLQQAGLVSGINYVAYPDAKRIPFAPGRLTGASECPVLYVNLHGQRFMDEGLFNKVYKGYQVARQKKCRAYAIFDSEILKNIETNGVMDVGYMDRDTNTLPNLTNIFEETAAEGTPCVVAADTLEELADKCGIEKDTFLQTVRNYNAACDDGWDKEFGKKRRYLEPVRSGRFYALEMRTEGYGTVGGIKVDADCQALDDEDDKIPGLFAAGDCANEIMSYNEAIGFKLWGSTLGFAVNSGRFAGESAAAYVGE